VIRGAGLVDIDQTNPVDTFAGVSGEASAREFGTLGTRFEHASRLESLGIANIGLLQRGAPARAAPEAEVRGARPRARFRFVLSADALVTPLSHREGWLWRRR
jgi:hypothetical protein